MLKRRTPRRSNDFSMEKLEKQDERNREIALEKTVEDTKKRILEVDIGRHQSGWTKTG